MSSETFLGNWWPSDSRDKSVGGVLTIFDDGKITLETVKKLSPGTFGGASDLPIVQGESRGRKITLIDLASTGSRVNIAGQANTSTEKFAVTAALVGVHLSGVDEKVFESMTAVVHNMNTWTRRTGMVIQYQYGPSPRGKDFVGPFKEVSVTASPMDSLSATLRSGDNLAIDWEIQSSGYIEGREDTVVTFKERAMAVVRSNEGREWDYFNRQLRPLVDLVTIATQVPSGIACQELRLTEGARERATTVDLYTRSPRLSAGSVKPHEMAFSLQDVEFDEIIARWFDFYSKIDVSIHALLGLDYDDGGFYENRLLNVASAAEGFHSRLFPDETGLPVDEYRDILEKLKSDFKDHPVRDWVLGRVSGNRPSLRGRIVQLGQLPDEIAVRDLVGDPDRFARILVRVRNDISHANKSLTDLDYPDDVLYRLEYISKAFLHLVAFQCIGLSADLQRRVVSERWSWSAAKFKSALDEMN